MSPRVSEAARLFAVAAFLVLVAQGPTFSGNASQLAAAGQTCTQTMTKEGGMQTTCTNTQADTTVGAGKAGGTKETQSGPCTDEKKAKMTKGELAKTCPTARKGTITAKGSGDGEDVTIEGGEGGMVSGGKGGSGTSGAVQQYASGDGSKQYLLTPPTPEGARIMNSAFPGVAPDSGQTAQPAFEPSPASVSSSPTPSGVTDVPGLSLGESVKLNDGVRSSVSSLAPSQRDLSGISHQGAPVLAGPATGFGGAQDASRAIVHYVNPSQPLIAQVPQSGYAGAIAPAEIFLPAPYEKIDRAALAPLDAVGITFDVNGKVNAGYIQFDRNITVPIADGQYATLGEVMSGACGSNTCSASELRNYADQYGVQLENTVLNSQQNGEAWITPGGVHELSYSGVAREPFQGSVADVLDQVTMDPERFDARTNGYTAEDGTRRGYSYAFSEQKPDSQQPAPEPEAPSMMERLAALPQCINGCSKDQVNFILNGVPLPPPPAEGEAQGEFDTAKGFFTDSELKENLQFAEQIKKAQQQAYDTGRAFVLTIPESNIAVWIDPPKRNPSEDGGGLGQIARSEESIAIPAPVETRDQSAPVKETPLVPAGQTPTSFAEGKSGGATLVKDSEVKSAEIAVKPVDAPAPADWKTRLANFFGSVEQQPTPEEQTKQYAALNKTAEEVKKPISVAQAVGDFFFGSSAMAEPAARTPSIADIFPGGPIRTSSAGSRIPSYTPQQVQQLTGRTFSTLASNFSDTQGTKGPLNQNNIFFSSPDLPEGTSLRVTVTNNKGVTTALEGKVLDFGPDTGQVRLASRKIDLSQGACRASDSCEQGLAQAKVEILPANAPVPNEGRVSSGVTSTSAPRTDSTFSISVSATQPGTKPTELRASVRIAPQNVSLCIGGTGCTIDSDAYINSLCQPDTGCVARQLGAQPDASYKEWVMNSPTERATDYKRQIEKVGANILGSRPVLIDNCQFPATCPELIAAIEEHNKLHPNAQILPMINNPVLVGEKLGREAAVNLLNRAAAAGGGGIWEPGGGSVAENAALRDVSKFPAMPLLAVGTAVQMQTVGRIIGTLGLKNIGTSISSQTEGGAGYRDGAAERPLTLGIGESTPQGALKRFSESQTPFVFGKAGADGKVELLDPKAAASAAQNGEKLDVYEPAKPKFPFNPSEYVKAGDEYYRRAGGVEEYRDAKAVQAQAAIENAARGLQIGAKLGMGAVVEGVGVSRPVYAANTDGSKGDRIGTLTMLTKEQAQIAAAARKIGTEALPCAQGMCSKDGKVLSLRAAQGSIETPKTVVPTTLGGKVVKLDGVPLQRMNHEQYIEAFRAAGVNVIDQSRQVFVPAWLQNPSANSRFIFHGDVAPGNRLIPYEARQLSLGKAAAQGVLREDGTLVVLKRLDTVSYHAPSSNFAGPGVETAGADNGKDATPAQFEAQQKMAGALLERGMEVGTHGKAEPSRRDSAEAGQSIVSYLYSGSAVLAPRVALFATGEDGVSVQVGEAMSSSAVATARETATYQPSDQAGAANGDQIALEPIEDLGKAGARLVTDADGNLGLAYDYTPPIKPDVDTRTAIERARDAAGRAVADANQRVRDMWGNMFGGQQPGGQRGGGGAQPAGNAVPASNSRPAGAAPAPASSGTPAPAPARTLQQPTTGQAPQGTNGGSSGQIVPTVSGGNTATGISGERFTCSPGTVVSGSAATPVHIDWSCPTGTTSVGDGFSTLGTNTGSVQLVVSTTSSVVTYKLTCQGAQTPQTLSCTVQVRHPRVTLVAKPATVAAGTPVALEWSAFDVTSCSLYAPPTVLLVTGGTSGKATTLPLSRSAVFSALCNVGSATTSASVTVLVQGDTGTPLQTVLPR